MNAKKIMGAVLVALLAAALLVGAGAAAGIGSITATVFVNQNLSVDDVGPINSLVFEGPNGQYTPATSPVNTSEYYFSAPGTYTYSDADVSIKFTVIAPTLQIGGVANKDDLANSYLFIPGNLYQGATTANVSFNVLNYNVGLPYKIYVTTPAKTLILDSADLTSPDKTNLTLDNLLAGQAKVGEYTIQAEFAANKFIPGTSPEQRVTAPVTFSVVKADSAVSISAAEATVLKTEGIKLTVTGQPGEKYNVTFDEWAFNVTEQIGFTFDNINGTYSVGPSVPQKTGIQFTMPAGGEATFVMKANLTGKVDTTEKIIVKAVNIPQAKQATIIISFMKGTISAQAEKESYFVGDTIKITGTSSAGKITYIALKGNNFLNNTFAAFSLAQPGDDFEITFDTGAILGTDGKLLDVGTYTLSVGNGQGVNATVPITLKQPFINIVSAPEVIVKGEEDIEIIINAEATTKVGYYIFGNNFYTYGETSTHVIDDDGETVQNQYQIVLDDVVKGMAAGQYFAVFQHPMNNEILDVHGNLNGDGSLANWIISVPTGQGINVDKRQTANAAQALCDALDAQSIDDMYVKATFFVSDKDNSFSISEIPTTVAQGETITISGVDTVNKGKPVVVEMLSSAFTAIPKEDENAAAFIVVTTTVADDGTWEVTLDTSALNVDEYNVAVKIADEIQKTATVNVVEAADEPVDPEQPGDEPGDEPEEPVAPETPGFGALAALAGLGAVAVLLLRRE